MSNEVVGIEDDPRFRQITEVLSADGLPFSEIPKDIQEVLRPRAQEAALILLDRLDSDSRKQLKHHRKIKTRFEKHIRRYWGKPFEQITLFIELVAEAGSKFNEEVRPTAVEKSDYKFDVLARLQARSCLLAGEIFTLMESGYSSGALSRWRTLHETAAVAVFISERETEVAERYLLHEVVEAYKAILEYQEHCATLGFDPYPEAEVNRVLADRDTLCDRFGKSFKKPQGWAAGALGKDDPSIKDIEEAARLAHYRPVYRMASHDVHANPKGVKGTLGLGLVPTGQKLMLAGPSDAGMLDPGQFLVISLCQILEAYLLTKVTFERLVTLTALVQFSEAIIVSLKDADTKLKEAAAKRGGFANM